MAVLAVVLITVIAIIYFRLDDDRDGLSGVGIAAIVIAVLAVVLITVIAIIYFRLDDDRGGLSGV